MGKVLHLDFFYIKNSAANPGSGAFLIPGSGMGKTLGSGSGIGSGMNEPDHISESLETIFGLKYLNSLMRIRDPGWKKFGSATLIRNIIGFECGPTAISSFLLVTL